VRRTLLSLLAALVLAGGCARARQGLVVAGAVPSTTTTTSAAPPLAWKTCGKFECATVPVPLDYAQPGGRQIGIAVNRRPATDRAHRIGSLLVNPGGPGASGVDALEDLVGRIPAEVRVRFDIVGFDPRGTGQSAPVHCLPSDQLAAYFAVDPTPDDATEKAAVLAADQRFVAGCQQRSGDLLAHVGTADAARDMDRIREAVGDEKLTYVGFSYGTLLGATYASLFPDRVRALVLDGAVDPSLDNLALNLAQGVGFDRAFDNFAASCRSQGAGCAWKPAAGATKETFIALSNRIDGHPVRAGRRQVGSSEFFLGTAAFLYSKSTWPLLAQALTQVESGDGTLVALGFDTLAGRNPDGSFSNEQEANSAINCVDRPSPKDPAVYEKAAADAAASAPAYGPAVAWSGLVCAYWPVPPTGRAGPLRAPGAPPILVVGTTNDPATPFAWSEAMASQLPARLLRHEGEGHTTYGENGCTNRIADAYLLTLALPPGDLTC
jgi:pimeloyl-ACP methyl ester carboxylesterase